jgi:hypothetical protein
MATTGFMSPDHVPGQVPVVPGQFVREPAPLAAARRQ